MDIITSKTDTAKMIFLFSIIILGIISIVALVIKLLVFVIRKIRKKNAKININILTIQVIYAASLVVMLTYLNCNMTCIPWFAAISAILALLLGLTSLINGFALVFRTVKERVNYILFFISVFFIKIVIHYTALIIISRSSEYLSPYVFADNGTSEVGVMPGIVFTSRT